MGVAAVKSEQPEPEESLGLDSLTAAETAMAEKQAAQSIVTLGNENFPQTALLGALGWVLARRSDPKISYVSYMATRKVSDITRELGLANDEPDDEDEAGKDDVS